MSFANLQVSVMDLTGEITEVSPSTHTMCVDTNGLPCQTVDGTLVLIDNQKPGGELVQVPFKTNILQAFGFHHKVHDVAEAGPSNLSGQINASQGCSVTGEQEICNKFAAKWLDDDAVRYLMFLKKEKMKDLFESTALSKARKWEKLSLELQAARPEDKTWRFNGKQCEYKYKDLKKRYNAVKDNQSDKSSGAAPISFAIFNV